MDIKFRLDLFRSSFPIFYFHVVTMADESEEKCRHVLLHQNIL